MSKTDVGEVVKEQYLVDIRNGLDPDEKENVKAELTQQFFEGLKYEKENWSYKKSQFAAKYYIEYIEDGFEPEELAESLAIQGAEQEDTIEARPSDHRTANEKADRLGRGHLNDNVVDELEEELNVGEEDFVNTAQGEIDAVKETVQDTDWKAVQNELKLKLRKKMRNEEVQSQLRAILKKHSTYSDRYSQQDIHEFANKITAYVAEEQSETISHKIANAMNTENISQEKENVDSALKSIFNPEYLAKGAAKGAGSEMAKKLTAKGLARIATLIGTVLTGTGYVAL